MCICWKEQAKETPCLVMQNSMCVSDAKNPCLNTLSLSLSRYLFSLTHKHTHTHTHTHTHKTGAKCQLQQGKLREAQMVLDDCLRTNPESPDAVKELETIKAVQVGGVGGGVRG